ncbi:MAG: hypothetical protein M0C28_13030 [Candidatus Moduliflexus flocculans]|nr:hypothetical protein [Candidatus Moduliflexus flocculans]
MKLEGALGASAPAPQGPAPRSRPTGRITARRRERRESRVEDPLHRPRRRRPRPLRVRSGAPGAPTAPLPETGLPAHRRVPDPGS